MLNQHIKHAANVIFVFSALAMLSGCSVYMAANQPPKKDTTVLLRGTPRTELIRVLGVPTATNETNGIHSDIFTFKQGYSKTTKILRSVSHATLDIVTLGLWEVAATPIEAINNGDDFHAEVTYDKDDKVSDVVMRKNNHVVNEID